MERQAKFSKMKTETSAKVISPRSRNVLPFDFDQERYSEAVRKLFCFCIVLGVVALIIFFSKQSLDFTANPLKPNQNNPSFKNQPFDKITTETPQSVFDAMDTTVDPCEDFYQYSCGNWIKSSSPLPKDKASISKSFTSISDSNRIILKQIIEEDWPLIGEFYSSCMNTTVLEALGSTPLQPLINEILAVSSVPQLFSLAGRISITGPTFLTAAGVSADAKNPSLNVLYLSQSGLTLPDRSYYREKLESIREPYLEFITDIMSSDVAQEILDFETRVAEITIPLEELRDPLKTYFPKTLNELEEISPLLFQQYLTGANIISNTSTSSPFPIIVETPSFFINAHKLVQNTSLSTLKNVLTYQLRVAFATSVDSKTYNSFFKFFGKTLAGQQVPTERWKRCVDITSSYLGELLSRYYVLKTNFSTTDARVMVSNIEVALSEKFDSTSVSWMDATTKAAAREKLESVSNLVGHPDTKLEYHIVLNASTYFENKLKLLRRADARAVARLGKPVDRNRWEMDASDVNAYYSPSKNQIVFPAGILQPPFFNSKMPLAMNYGSIGVVIGHELTHGFDDSGRKFNKIGKLENWWSNETAIEFENRSSCLVEQYSKFEMLDERSGVIGNVNGNLTLGENIADNGGLVLAYNAFLKHHDATSTTTTTHDRQLFFLSFGQTWCSVNSAKSVEARLVSDVHSPSKWRVNGAVMNNAEFAKAFSCPASSAMNPSKKCVLW